MTDITPIVRSRPTNGKTDQIGSSAWWLASVVELSRYHIY
jgi:hypothetical protein